MDFFSYSHSYLRCFFYAEKSLLMIAELPFPETMFGQIFQMTNYFFGALFLSIILGQVDVLSPKFLSLKLMLLKRLVDFFFSLGFLAWPWLCSVFWWLLFWCCNVFESSIRTHIGLQDVFIHYILNLTVSFSFSGTCAVTILPCGLWSTLVVCLSLIQSLKSPFS